MILITDKKKIRQIFLISVLCFMTTIVITNYLFQDDIQTANNISSLLYTLLVIQVLAACIHAYKNSKSYKRLWLFMSIGMAFWVGGTSTLSYYTIIQGVDNVPSPSLADAFCIGYIPIITGIMLSLGRIRRPFDNDKKQCLTNIAMLALVAFVVCFKFALIPILYQRPDLSALSKSFMIVYPLSDWCVFISILFASRSFKNEQIEGSSIFLILAFSCAVIADITFYLNNNLMNPISFLLMIGVAILITAASIDDSTGAFIGTINRKSKNILPSITKLAHGSFQALLVPIISTLTLTIIWLSWFINGLRIEIPVLIIGSILLMMLLIYKTHLLISDNAILYAKSMSDNLTGLNNHRYFQEALSKTINKADSSNKPLSLIIVDVDGLSSINNRFGHGTGDRVLKILGSVIRNELREADEACRLSDDTFAIILPKTLSANAYDIAIQLKLVIDNAFAQSFPKMHISISIGLSTYPTLVNSKDDLLNTADGALYWCKLNGKDNVLLYDPEIVEALNADDRANRVEENITTEMIRSLAQTVDARDSYTRMHSKGVSGLAASLAEYIGLDKETIKRVEVAGTLHDIGKIGIPDNILNKPGRLNSDEINIIMSHPSLSAQIIQSSSLKEIVPAVEAHHERWDGSGYPKGLKGTEIPIEARILAIADTFDAMTTNRPYRNALSVYKALTEIKRCSGTQFDPILVNHFLAMFKNGSITDQNDSKESDNGENLAINI